MQSHTDIRSVVRTPATCSRAIAHVHVRATVHHKCVALYHFIGYAKTGARKSVIASRSCPVANNGRWIRKCRSDRSRSCRRRQINGWRFLNESSNEVMFW